MRTDLYWIPTAWPGRLAIMPRPRGGDWLEDEIQSWRRAGVDVVVSLLTLDEVTDLGLAGEGSLCRANGIQYITFPIVDRNVPASKEGFAELVTNLGGQLAEGKNVAVHCRQGIGRAALVAICLVVLSGIDLDTASQHVSKARGCVVPETAEQRQWVAQFAASIMVRQ